MDDMKIVVDRFEAVRPRLEAVAYRMLGVRSIAEDVVQESWLRLAGADRNAVRNLEAWLTRVVARLSLDILRTSAWRREQSLNTLESEVVVEPEEEATLEESVRFAMQVVLQRLSPAERVALVLHDVFDLPFAEISAILSCSIAASRQHASRARRKLRAAEVPLPSRLHDQDAVTAAYFAAARRGDIGALVDSMTARPGFCKTAEQAAHTFIDFGRGDCAEPEHDSGQRRTVNRE